MWHYLHSYKIGVAFREFKGKETRHAEEKVDKERTRKKHGEQERKKKKK